jgi:hypothetical protein
MNTERNADALQWRALVIGVAGLMVCAVVACFRPGSVLRSYLVAFNFWLAIALGCLAVLMLYHLTGGQWGFILRRLLEASSRTLPLMPLLFLPIIFGLHQLYLWTDPSEVAADRILQHKAQYYLNIPGFIIRAAVYFSIWLAVAYFLNRWSREQDQTADPEFARRMRILSGPGLVFYGLAVTFASVDWLMSLDPRWYSTIFPVVFAVGQVQAGLAFAIAVLALLVSRPPLSRVISTPDLWDIGNLLQAFVMFWAYVAFAQFLLIWCGNLPEEIRWYTPRFQGGWEWFGVVLICCQFVLPFLLLLSRHIKRNPRTLCAVAIFLLVMRFVDLFWEIVPAFPPADVMGHWLDFMVAVVAAAGVGGLWLAFFCWQLKRLPLLPLHEPEFANASPQREQGTC